MLVTEIIEVAAVDRQVGIGIRHGYQRRREEIDEGYLLFFGDLFNDLNIILDLGVVPIGRGNILNILIGNRRNEYDPWPRSAVEGLRFQ